MSKKILRSYQARIVETVVKANTIVLLPTGSGKTLIAAEAIARVGTPSVFFVPTIPLVGQQAAAIRSHLPTKDVAEFNGECSLPQTFDVLVTTPKAFEAAQARGMPYLSWKNFRSVVFDEVHHAIKDHPYRNLALKLKQSCANPRVIGLTASLTYAIGEKKINSSVGRLCEELQIEKIENAPNTELLDGGYTGAGRGALAEVRLPEVERSENLVPLRDRKPHLMHAMFFDRIKNKEATSFGTKLVKTIQVLENVVASEMLDFTSPLPNVSLKSWGEYASKQSYHHDLLPTLEHFYEALRLLVISWEENEDVALAYLQMMRIPITSHRVPHVTVTIKNFFDSQKVSLARFDNLYDVLSEKIERYRSGFRCILFVKQRVVTHILKHAIENHSELGHYVKAQCIYSTKTSATASLSVSKQESKNALKSFGKGSSNMLIATNVAEEGLDIPEANCVIYFDPMDHAVSYVQGRGRARQAESSFVMLDERADRPASLLAKQEAEQHNVASSFALENFATDQQAKVNSQKQREQGGAKYLLHPSEENSIQNLHTFCKKTKVVVDESATQTKGSVKTWNYHLVYRSVTRTVSGKGMSENKKRAKRAAAVDLLNAIKMSIEHS